MNQLKERNKTCIFIIILIFFILVQTLLIEAIFDSNSNNNKAWFLVNSTNTRELVIQYVLVSNDNGLYPNSEKVEDIINKSSEYIKVVYPISDGTIGIFEFLVENLFSINKSFTWGFDTNDTAGVIWSDEAITLEEDENISILFEHNFSSTGAYQISAKANTSSFTYSESLNVTLS